MPTRIRVLLQNTGGSTLCGKRAVAYLWENVSAKDKKTVMVFSSRAARLQALMAFQPPDWVLTLVREPKKTRKSRSLYWKMRERQGVEPIEPVAFLEPIERVLRADEEL